MDTSIGPNLRAPSSTRRRDAARAVATFNSVPSSVPVRRLETVSDIARELVRMAIGNGYRREEPVRLIDTLW